MDEYDDRIQELKDEQFEISGLVAPLALDAPERLWWQGRAARVVRELQALYEHADELREMDSRIHRCCDEIDHMATVRDARVARWSRLATTSGVLGGLLLLLCVLTFPPSWWLPVLGFALVSVAVLASRRAGEARMRPDPVLVDRAARLDQLEAEHAAILAGAQSPSASMAASTPDRSSTLDHVDTLELPRGFSV